MDDDLGAASVDIGAAIDADKVILPADAEYDRHRLSQFAARCGSVESASTRLSPSVIVYCSTEAQVVSAVRFARTHGYSVVCRSGGHSYSGLSSTSQPRSMQIDLSGMNQLRFEGHVAIAGPGVRLRKLVNALMFRKLNVPHGVCKDVGLGGHLQSSGWGMAAGGLGSALDFVTGITIVLADGTVRTLSGDDEDPSLFKAVLGGSPGSWGVITQFKLRCLPDSQFPHTRMVLMKYRYTKETMIGAVKAVQSASQDQEAKGPRDLNIYMDVGPMAHELDIMPDIPLLGSLSNLFNFEKDPNPYILIAVLWIGGDSGKLTKALRKELFAGLDAIPGKRLRSVNLPLPLSIVTSLATSYKNQNYRYHVDAFTCDRWFSDEFIDSFADNFEQRRALANAYPRFQLGFFTAAMEFHKYANANTLVGRSHIARMDNWTFFLDSRDSEKIGSMMREYRNGTARHWLCTTGREERVWMTPCTYDEDFTDLRNPETAAMFHPDATLFLQLRILKTIVDPRNVFHGKGTIPPLSADEIAQAIAACETRPHGVSKLFDNDETLRRLKRLAH